MTRPYSIITCLRELADPGKTRIILYPNDTEVETSVNTWSISRGPDHTLADLAAVEAGLWEVARKWTNHFSFYSNPFKARLATFYALYDELAGALFVSMVSQSIPPFGAPRTIIDSPRPILRELLQDRAPAVISNPPEATVWVHSKTW